MLVSQMRKRDIVVGSWLKSCISAGGINRLKKYLSVFFILLSRLCKDFDTSNSPSSTLLIFVAVPSCDLKHGSDVIHCACKPFYVIMYHCSL